MTISCAPEKIYGANTAADSAHIGFALAFDPAVGTLEMSADLKLKARKAISRELRILKFRLYLSFLFLYFEKFSLQMRGFRLRLFRKIASYLSKLVLD
jgi:hypothetical protein